MATARLTWEQFIKANSLGDGVLARECQMIRDAFPVSLWRKGPGHIRAQMESKLRNVPDYMADVVQSVEESWRADEDHVDDEPIRDESWVSLGDGGYMRRAML